jgi:hypothetical protein
MDHQRKPRAIIEASLLRAKRSEIQKFQTIGGKNAGSAIEKNGEIFRNRCASPERDFHALHLLLRPTSSPGASWTRRDALGRKQLTNALDVRKEEQRQEWVRLREKR